MTYRQLITPNPNIACEPGWCLKYVRETFGLPARYASATEAWNASTTKHTGLDFPEGVWVPLWFGLASEPLGHVVNRAPDGSIYSTSDNSTVPHHHPNLSDLIRYYANAGVPLTYRGWTEDVAGYPVIAADGINFESITTIPLEDDMTPEEKKLLFEVLDTLNTRTAHLPDEKDQGLYWTNLIGAVDKTNNGVANLVSRPPAEIAAQINAAGLAAAVRDELVRLIGGAK